MDAHPFVSPLSHFDATPLLESLALPVLILDRDCCVIFANAMARSLLGLGVRDLRGQPLDLLFEEGHALRLSLARMFTGSGSSRSLRQPVRELAQPARRLALKALLIDDDLTGPHLLVQLARARQRKRQPVLKLLPRTDRPIEAVPQLECA
ncbi:MAG: PAS domain-containing protein [Steroidobacteraceae bacterium]